MIAGPGFGQFNKRGFVQPGDRWRSIAAVAAVHLALAYALLFGLSIEVQRSAAAVTRLIAVQLAPPVPVVPVEPKVRAAAQAGGAPVAAHDPPGGSTGPSKIVAPNPVAPIFAMAPTVSPGGNLGHGTLTGSGSGGGTGGQGNGIGNGDGAGDGDGDGGADLEQLSGEFRSSDYPGVVRTGVGGRVEFRYIVGAAGRVTGCVVTRSSGNADLDSATCRVVIKRFRYRPSTDANGRPIPAIVEGEVDWNDLSRDD
ncbi:MAG: TonB family protein [Sphingomicrobium sp.]